jgi:tRNA pseudouridine13 synthase
LHWRDFVCAEPDFSHHFLGEPMTPTFSVPHLTADLPGVGGRIKSAVEDFEVEEIPAYLPCGSGDHLYLWLEKRDLSAELLVRYLTEQLRVPAADIGTAGLKDRRAVTRQWVSVPAAAEANLPNVGGAVRILDVSRHTNKLRAGHLRGNRFRVRVGETPPGAEATARAILDRLERDGLPNYYGKQRFGRDGSTGRLGMDLLTGRAAGRPNPFLRKLALSAAQSQLFNDYLARRLADGLMREVLVGDVLAKWPAGGMFVSTDPAADQPRLAAREVVPAGPMFGRKMFAAAGPAAQREAAVLVDAGLTERSFHGFGSLLAGTRRHNFIYPGDVTCTSEADGLRLTFTLPAGSYATVLLSEVMKCELDEGP